MLCLFKKLLINKYLMKLDLFDDFKLIFIYLSKFVLLHLIN